MKDKHPTIIICYIPGGCTGLWQPLDVAIQRPMKLCMKRSAHKDVVEEATALLRLDTDDDVNPALLKLDTSILTLRNRCIGWIIDSFHACNNKELIMKSFELCAVGEFNCSQESLKSPAALAALRDLPKTDPALYAELTQTSEPEAAPTEEDLFDSDEEDNDFNDESDIPVDVVISHVMARVPNLPAGFALAEDGSIVRNGVAEDAELDIVVNDLPLSVRRTRRAAKPNRAYGNDWEEH
ncbi:hypothetical protein GGX14DRAFT_372060 [Mycena pura]|uniref:Uncharacterized protein n=1 Tax=Mycena pura TaxID=153505 RepID=A0AAD6Y7G9_9AGAR|nr:hypothetical protein GGX14DRAFT_372060 [Mycena pura]